MSNTTIGAVIEVHRQLGPRLLESAYREYLHCELLEKGIKAEEKKQLPIVYKKVKLGHGYLVLDSKLVVAIKTVEALTDVHMAQLLTYLRLRE